MENRSAPPKKTLWQRLKNMGPAAIVSAALIGPGTVTTSGLTGCNFGFALVWAVLFSVIAMVITQRMTGKIGLHTGIGLAAAIRKVYHGKAAYWPLAVLLILSFFVSNCAYQASNIVGAASGAAVLFGDHRALYCIIISAAALALVLSGSIKYISNVLTVVVFLMVVLFLATAIVVKPDVGAILKGMFIPSIPSGAQMTAIALIGTTMTPYCLYLHSDTHASEKLENPGVDVNDALVDNTLASIVNAMAMLCVTTSIMVVGHALALNGGSISTVTDLADGLKPLIGSAASPSASSVRASVPPPARPLRRRISSAVFLAGPLTCGTSASASSPPSCSWSAACSPSSAVRPQRSSPPRRPSAAWRFPSA